MPAPAFDYPALRARRDRGDSWDEIARGLEPPADPNNLRKAYSKWFSRNADSVPETFDEVYTERPAASAEKWPFPVRPVRISIPQLRVARPQQASDLFSIIHIPDIHVPFHDGQALGVLYAYLAENSVDAVICHGDLIDAYPLSAYDKDRGHRISQQAELEMAASVLARITQLTPGAAFRWYLEGNHENRLTRLLNKMAQDRSIGEILDLKLVREALSWPVLLGLDGLGWSYHAGRKTLFNRLIVKHGDVVRKHAGYTARAEMDKYHCSGMSGHTHRIGRVTQSDHNGIHGWWEIGCLCDLEPSYTADPNWQHGFAISTWDLSDPDRPQYQVDQINIHSGRAIVHGRVYTSLDEENL